MVTVFVLPSISTFVDESVGENRMTTNVNYIITTTIKNGTVLMAIASIIVT